MEVLVTGKDPEKVPEIEKKVEEQGNKVRQMKTEKKDKKDIDQAVTGKALTCDQGLSIGPIRGYPGRRTRVMSFEKF